MRLPRLAVLLLILAALAVYADSFRVPFVFDDPLSTVENPTIRHWSTAFFPPHRQGLTVEGRPILNASLALNWAISGPQVWSYHLVNLLIHVGAGLTLLAILRRVVSETAALVIALLWTVHPLQTESVTYIVQRAESLMGLFYLLTLYCFLRSTCPTGSDGLRSGSLQGFRADPEAKSVSKPVGPSALGTTRSTYAILSVLFCWLGMSTKEDMVSAPLIILLFDRAFISGSFRAAWQRHGRLHCCLFATWLWLAFLMVGTGSRGHTSGFGSGISIGQYWPSQAPAVAHYLRLVYWPAPLVFDYGTQWVTSVGAVIAPGLLILALISATVFGLVKNRPWALPACFFFALLAPNSLVAGNRQTSAEHRMYLPLAAVLALTVAGVESVARRRGRTTPWLIGTGLLALPLGLAAAARNLDYRSQMNLYADIRQKLPTNKFNRYNYGKMLYDAGEFVGALAEYQEAIRLDSGMVNAYDNLGNTFRELGRLSEAEAAYRSALQLDPNLEKARYNLGNVLLQLGRKPEAAEQFNDAVLLKPDDLDARDNLGGVLLELGQPKDAEEQFRAVIARSGGSVETHFNLGTAYLLEGRTSDARTEFETCLKIKPGYPPALQRLAQLR